VAPAGRPRFGTIHTRGRITVVSGDNPNFGALPNSSAPVAKLAEGKMEGFFGMNASKHVITVNSASFYFDSPQFQMLR
jgi:hypothetical protein